MTWSRRSSTDRSEGSWIRSGIYEYVGETNQHPVPQDRLYQDGHALKNTINSDSVDIDLDGLLS